MSLRAWRWISENDVSPRGLLTVLVCLTIGLAGARAQSAPSLRDAVALYDSASFDESLTVLDGLARAQPETDVEDVQRYRALCLLALNRTAEAQAAIEIVLSRDPLYRLSEGDAPPRMRTAFGEVRRRLLPKVTEQLYTSAKLSFDRKEYALAATQFSDLLRFLDEPDARDLSGLKEFRTLAVGFRDLSIAAQASIPKLDPPPAPAPVANAAPVNAPAVNTSPAPAVATPARTPAAKTAAASSPAPAPGVLVPPVIVKQQMPLWLGMGEFLPRGGRGRIRIIVDEQGGVEEARIVESVHIVYDALLLSAARTWKYEPATLDGKPVRYAKVIEVILKPQ
jgi:TonB family protein